MPEHVCMEAEPSSSVVERWLAAGDREDVDAFDALLTDRAFGRWPTWMTSSRLWIVDSLSDRARKLASFWAI